MTNFLVRAAGSIGHRLRLRFPKATARATRQFPLRSVKHLYSERPSGQRRIPNVMYQTWENDCVGRSHGRALAAFRSLNDDYSFRLYDGVALERYMAERWRDHPIHDVFANAQFGPLRTDIWRYCILYDRGGAYCDIGKAMTLPLRDQVTDDTGAVISFERNRAPQPATGAAREALAFPDMRVVNWAFQFAAGHPLLKDVIDGIVDKYSTRQNQPFDNPKQAIMEFTGPIHLTECVHAYAARHGMDDVTQAGTDFGGTALLELPGSYVRYTAIASYSLAKGKCIVA